jgi:hypothetical protein
MNNEYLQIPCSCSDCMNDLPNAIILKANFKVGDKVVITKTGWNDYAKGRENLDLSINTIQDVREEEGQIMYTAYGLNCFLSDELELGEGNLIVFKKRA